MSASETRQVPCWIQGYVEATSSLPSPSIFRRWAAIAGIAAALERRCWIDTGGGRIYPHMYTMLIAPPGVGKSKAIDPIVDMLHATDSVPVASSSITKASMVDELAEAEQEFQLGLTKIKYHSLFFGAAELGVLIHSYDNEFFAFLNEVWDAKRSFSENRRHFKEKLVIDNPVMNILSGAQPAYLGSLLPDTAFDMGFASRCMMIYSEDVTKIKLFGPKAEVDTGLVSRLQTDLLKITQMSGDFSVHPDAVDVIEKWNEVARTSDAVQHPKFSGYNSRRVMHCMKICMALSAAQGGNKVITVDHFSAAHRLMRMYEADLPRLITRMANREHGNLMSDLLTDIRQVYFDRKMEPLDSHTINRIIGLRYAASQIQHTFNYLTQNGFLEVSAKKAFKTVAGMQVEDPNKKYYVPTTEILESGDV